MLNLIFPVLIEARGISASALHLPPMIFPPASLNTSLLGSIRHSKWFFSNKNRPRVNLSKRSFPEDFQSKGEKVPEAMASISPKPLGSKKNFSLPKRRYALLESSDLTLSLHWNGIAWFRCRVAWPKSFPTWQEDTRSEASNLL